ncbi:hypothetical protein PZA11_007207 [Diplocarpon coronariae]
MYRSLHSRKIESQTVSPGRVSGMEISIALEIVAFLSRHAIIECQAQQLSSPFFPFFRPISLSRPLLLAANRAQGEKKKRRKKKMANFPRLSFLSSSRPQHQYEPVDPSEGSESDELESQREPKEPLEPPTTKSRAIVLSVVRVLRGTALFFVPSFLQKGAKKAERRITETSYLNGVRGLAAALVYLQHMSFALWIHIGWDGRPEDYPIQLPFLRLVYSGRFMVAIFFILSGYVLAYKPLQLARNGDSNALYKNLSSAVFRRTPRLFLPILPAMAATAAAIYFTCYGDMTFNRGRCLPRESSLLGQIWGYTNVLGRMLDPASWSEYYPPGLDHLWTLPMEHRGSMIIFLLVAGLGNTTPIVRLGFLMFFAMFFLHMGRWDTSLFVSGGVLAELRVFRKESPLNLESRCGSEKSRMLLKTVTTIFWVSTFVLALFIGSWPAYQASNSMGFRYFSRLTPAAYTYNEAVEEYFWISIAAFLLLLSFENLEILQRPFTTEIASYMGDISFGFYIVHWTMLFTVGTVIIGNFRVWLPYGYPNYNVGFFVGGALTTPLVIMVGDAYWRVFDMGAVKWARWLNGKCEKKVL